MQGIYSKINKSLLDVGARPGPLMRCRCCPGLDLLPIRCRGQRGTGAAPPSVSGGQKLHCAGCDRCQLSSFTRPLHYKGPSTMRPTLQMLCLLHSDSGLLTTLPSFLILLLHPPPHLYSTQNAINSVPWHRRVFQCYFLARCLCLVVMGILLPFKEPNHLARFAKMSRLFRLPKGHFLLTTYICMCTHILKRFNTSFLLKQSRHLSHINKIAVASFHCIYIWL